MKTTWMQAAIIRQFDIREILQSFSQTQRRLLDGLLNGGDSQALTRAMIHAEKVAASEIELLFSRDENPHIATMCLDCGSWFITDEHEGCPAKQEVSA